MTNLQKDRLIGGLRELIYNHDFTTVKLAKKLRVNQSTVSRWVSGDRFPSEVSFSRIARFIKRSR